MAGHRHPVSAVIVSPEIPFNTQQTETLWTHFTPSGGGTLWPMLAVPTQTPKPSSAMLLGVAAGLGTAAYTWPGVSGSSSSRLDSSETYL